MPSINQITIEQLRAYARANDDGGWAKAEEGRQGRAPKNVPDY